LGVFSVQRLAPGKTPKRFLETAAMRNPTSRPEPAPSGEAGNGAAESFFWTLLAGAQNREDLCHSFIALQCSMVPTAVQGLLVVEAEPDGGFSPAAAWPEQGADPERLAELCERAIEERCGMLLELAPDAGGGLRYGAAYPVLVDGRPRAVVAVEVTASSEAALTQVMHHLQWGGAWMETLVRRERGEAIENAFSRLRSAVDILAAVLSVDSFQESSMTFVTELATRLSCERVSIAFVRKGRSRIQAISHSARFGKRMNLIRAISQAMDEALAQRKEVFFPRPPDGEIRIVRDHERLAQQHGAGAILTMPFFGENRYDGVVTLERPEDAPFSLQDAEFCRSVASLLLPTLLLKRQNDRNAFLRFWDDAKSQCVKLFGPRYPGRKLAVALAAAASQDLQLMKYERKE
jgi:hypothetical protein